MSLTLSFVKFGPNDVIRLFVELDSNVPEGATPDASVLKELQLAVVGDFVSGKYGRFQITEADVDSMIRNYGTVYPINPTELAIDYDHLSTPDPGKPRTPGDGVAAAWIKKIYKKATLLAGRAVVGMFAEVEYTPRAAKMVRDKEYKFFSPTFVKQWANSLGQKTGATLLGGALTNHPFLHGMSAVQLSSEFSFPYTGVPTMADKTIKLKDASGAEVEIKLDDLTAHADVKAAFPATKVETKVETKTDDKTPIGLDAAAVQAAVTAAMAPLVQTMTTLSSDMQAMKTEKAANQFETAFNKYLKAGKVVPAQKDFMKKLSDADHDSWAKGMDAGPVLVKLSTNGVSPHAVGDGGTPIDGGNPDDAQDALDKAVQEHIEKNAVRKLSYDVALAEVQKAHPELATAALQSFR